MAAIPDNVRAAETYQAAQTTAHRQRGGLYRLLHSVVGFVDPYQSAIPIWGHNSSAIDLAVMAACFYAAYRIAPYIVPDLTSRQLGVSTVLGGLVIHRGIYASGLTSMFPLPHMNAKAQAPSA